MYRLKEAIGRFSDRFFECFLLDLAEASGVRNCDFPGENARIEMRRAGYENAREKSKKNARLHGVFRLVFLPLLRGDMEMFFECGDKVSGRSVF